MSKTIEELAKQYAEYMCPAEDYSGGISDEERNFDMSVCIDDAKSVLGWLFNKPLIQRLTEAEKERIIEMYDDANTYCESVFISEENEETWSSYNEQRHFLEEIFGKEFFKEDKL